MEPVEGVEPPTIRLQGGRSTTELHRPGNDYNLYSSGENRESTSGVGAHGFAGLLAEFGSCSLQGVVDGFL